MTTGTTVAAPGAPDGAVAGPVFIGSEVYRGSSYGRWHPLAVPRVPQVMDLCRALGWLPAGQYRISPRARPAALTLWHTPDYVAALQQAEAEQAASPAVQARHNIGTTANPIFPEMFRRPATGVGGVMLAATLLRHGGVVHAPGGGTHHGLPDRANGFCYFNDPVIAVLALRAEGCARIAYVDIDAHHCDGVDHAFANDPAVLTVSVHEENRWPRTGAITDRGCGNLVNLPVPKGLNDNEMALIRDDLILRRVAGFRPDAIVMQCGADALAEDPMSRLSLSNNAHIAILRGLRALSPRLMVLGGGGYNPWSVGRLWTRVWAELAGHPVPDRLPPPARAVLDGLRWTGLRERRPVQLHWRDTLRDLPAEGPIRDAIRTRIAAHGRAMV
ncbi:acetoin utilization protein AcuC [Meridianimarinicoccus sp. RP-17]|uniref:acetoin utilization protein AcuC n=1 Tax=Meridianimarinicoccus zhengii TaxID=2056810 RepID=UPI001F3AAF8E|nr:acetoin utilization protein AcuC [Phycocomes zhengii]